jgi:Family of unknown function (DUF6074)
MAEVIPFPRVRDRRYVLRHARRMASLPERTAEKPLRRQLKIQVETMLKRGIDPDLIERERAALELAVRIELRRMMLSSGGVA